MNRTPNAAPRDAARLIACALLLVLGAGSASAGGVTCDDISCAPGFHCVETPAGAQCVANSCADIDCGPGYSCHDSPTGPICSPNLTCETFDCAPGYHCVDTPYGPGCVCDCPEGFHCDTIDFINTICVANAVGVSFPDPPEIVRLGSVYPNPSRSDVAIWFSLPGGPATLRIYDVAGHSIRTLVAGSVPAGSHSVYWDRRSDPGAVVQPGLYFCELRAGGQKRVRRIMLVR